jgi:hypothetical protein
MIQEDVVKERRERIALACLQGLLAGPNLAPNEKLSKKELIRGIVMLSCMMADEFIQEIDGEVS